MQFNPKAELQHSPVPSQPSSAKLGWEPQLGSGESAGKSPHHARHCIYSWLIALIHTEVTATQQFNYNPKTWGIFFVICQFKRLGSLISASVVRKDKIPKALSVPTSMSDIGQVYRWQCPLTNSKMENCSKFSFFKASSISAKTHQSPVYIRHLKNHAL